MILSIFLCICWPFVCLVWKNVYSDPLTIFKVRFLLLFLLLLGCTSSLYTLTSINPLLDMICKYVLPSKCCLLLLLIVFFTVQKVFLFDIVSLIWSQSLYIYIAGLMSRRCLLMCFSRSFMVSGLIFKSLIHVELIFL